MCVCACNVSIRHGPLSWPPSTTLMAGSPYTTRSFLISPLIRSSSLSSFPLSTTPHPSQPLPSSLLFPSSSSSSSSSSSPSSIPPPRKTSFLFAFLLLFVSFLICASLSPSVVFHQTINFSIYHDLLTLGPTPHYTSLSLRLHLRDLDQWHLDNCQRQCSTAASRPHLECDPLILRSY